MAYQVLIEKRPAKYLSKLPKKRYEKISDLIRQLKDFPRVQVNIFPIKGAFEKNSYRLRVGDWRVLFTVYDQQKVIKIWKIDTRGDVY